VNTEIEKTTGTVPGRTPPKVRVSDAGDLVPVGKPETFAGELAQATGTVDTDVGLTALKSLFEAAGSSSISTNGLLAIAASLEPRSAAEGALAQQFALAHTVAMNMGANAIRLAGPAKVEATRSLATATKTCIALLEALDRHRRPPESRQVVRVERVEIAPGAQGIVGNVTGGDGGGLSK